MIKIALLLSIITALSPLSAKAQILVRSGEHENFSRLVFYLDSPAENWKIEKSKSGVRLVSPPNSRALQFDLSSIFEFIPRTRITDVFRSSEGLEVISSCKCKMHAFAHDQSTLVVDVRDSDNLNTPRHSGLIASTASDLREPLPSSSLPSGFVTTKSIDLQRAPSLVGFMPGALSKTLPKNFKILRAISENVAGGILSPTPQERSLGGTSLIDQGIVISNALDAYPATSAATMKSEDICPTLDFMNLKNASMQPGEQLFALAIAMKNLASEIDNPTEETVLELFNTYLLLGFGAEAKLVLSTFSNKESDVQFLDPIADIVDTPGNPNAAYPIEFISCSGMASVWAFLAAPPTQLTRYDFDAQSLLRTLSALPITLRSHLAPSIAQKFTDIFRPEDASLALASVGRASVSSTTQFDPIERPPLADQQVGARHERAQTGIPSRWQGELANEHFGDTVLEVITNSRLDLSDRIFIEASIKDSPNQESQLEAIAFYTQSLSKKGQATTALSYLDQLQSETKLLPASLHPVFEETLSSVAETATRGEILAVSASLHNRTWFTELNGSGKDNFLKRVAEIKQESGLQAAEMDNGTGLEDSNALTIRGNVIVNPTLDDTSHSAVESDALYDDTSNVRSTHESALNEVLARGERSLAEAVAIRDRMDTLLTNW
ncbi:hypothetical protein [Meridianimarinicoccus aquatilis]|uniref:Uncharacterized protein n=1 Tax=Meridianimarinicoccus aquatilis TaxID=2552766 RepID=A0A4R6AR72_9RHOB|nr:hypothetical protein [Fluviibacterium aquatile]TDL87001.1 hypothetical protein E2L05_11895 [Fluviibacterium aquatile]